MERLAAQYLADGSLSVTEREAFRAAVKNLQEMYKEHISVEDSIVFPLAAQMLSESDKAAIAHEMAQRRQAAVVVGIDIPRAGQ